MKINNYIDWVEMFKHAVREHLEEFPTPEKYKNEMEGVIDDLSFIDELYLWLGENRKHLSEFELNSDEDCDYRHFKNPNVILFEFSQSEDTSTENGSDESGCMYTFEYDMDWDCFVNLSYEGW